MLNLNLLKPEYKRNILLVILLCMSPLLSFFIYQEWAINALENSYIIHATADKYNIDIQECLKCQEGGWVFIMILLLYLTTLLLASFVLPLFLLSIMLKVLYGISLILMFNVFIKGKYPQHWFVDYEKNT